MLNLFSDVCYHCLSSSLFLDICLFRIVYPFMHPFMQCTLTKLKILYFRNFQDIHKLSCYLQPTPDYRLSNLHHLFKVSSEMEKFIIYYFLSSLKKITSLHIYIGPAQALIHFIFCVVLVLFFILSLWFYIYVRYGTYYLAVKNLGMSWENHAMRENWSPCKTMKKLWFVLISRICCFGTKSPSCPAV